MKKSMVFFLALLMVLFPVMCVAGWVTANQATVSWDYNDTSDLTDGERLVYRVYIANHITDPDKVNPIEVGETLENSLLITLAVKGQYRAGVKAVLQVMTASDEWEDVSESLMSWSDDPTVTKDGVIFGIRFYPAPVKPGGLTTL